MAPDVLHRHSLRVSVGWLSIVEMLVLGSAATLLVVEVIPSAFEIEFDCIGRTGTARTVGDTYLAAFAGLGTLAWLGVLLGIIYAEIAGALRLVAILPLVWFAVVVVGALVTAAAIGPALCPV
jgi:hypothetical protein